MEIVTPLAAKATKSIIDAAGRRLRGLFATPEKENALRACVDAGLAAVLIAEKISPGNTAQVRTVMKKVAQSVQSDQTRARAKKVLQTPQP